jgi:hypothetical protein
MPATLMLVMPVAVAWYWAASQPSHDSIDW